ncbi:hypothetical protein BBJ28_00005469 [Nothophytophthora sp. Chile5]|nr:hypothetical protein BBJ28_00005469 [Nothophytophthora sp. Chile5]
MLINARAVPDSVLVRSRKAGSKISLAGSDGVGADILATDDFIAEEMEIQGDYEDVLVEGDSVLSEDEEELAEGRWQLPKEFMFLVSSFIVLFTSGGLILGFGPMYSMLVRENQWSELCSEEERKDAVSGNVLCAAQEIRLQYVFSTGFLCLSAANAFFGVFIDVVGPRLTIMLSLTLSALGNFALGFGDSHTGNGAWIIIGYSLVGAGGMGSYLAAFQILQLYQVQGVVCSTLSSLFNCSGYVYMLLGVQGVTRLGFFQVYGYEESGGAPTGLLDGMREEIKRPDLWFFAILFGWISLIFAFAGGAIPSLLVKLAGKDTRAASLFTNFLYPVLVNGTFVYSPLVGYAIDRYGFKVIFAACIILVQLFIALLLVPSLRVQLFMFFVYAMAQACLYALQFAYVSTCLLLP